MCCLLFPSAAIWLMLTLLILQEEQAQHASEFMQDASTSRILPRTAVQEQPESPFLAGSRVACSPEPAGTSPLRAGGGADGGAPPRGSSERRKVSFNVETKEDSSSAGPDGASSESIGRAISLQELREVMKQMHYTRCALSKADVGIPGRLPAGQDVADALCAQQNIVAL